MLADEHDFFVGILEGTCFLRYITFNDTYNFFRVDNHIVGANAVVGSMDIHHLTVVPHFTRFPRVVQVARIGVMELVMLDDDALGKTDDGAHDATC